MRKPNNKIKPACPFKVGDRVKFYDASRMIWDYAATILEINCNVLTVQLDDDSDATPIEVGCEKDFSDVRAIPQKRDKKQPS